MLKERAKVYYYQVFQLTVKSALLLPELNVLNESPTNIDIVIDWGEVPKTGLPHRVSEGKFYQSDEHAFWMDVPSVARYLVSDGASITIDPYDGADKDSISLFLLGSCMGALMMQRDTLLLHANAIRVGDVCVSFAGFSGVGKSTLSAALMRRGYPILADDVCAINLQGEVIPSYPYIKLWADSRQKLAINTELHRRIRPNLEKFSVPLHESFCNQHLPLQIVYILNEHNEKTFEITPLHGMQKMEPLKRNTYRYDYLKGLERAKNHLKRIGALASQVDVVRLKRPNFGFQLTELVDFIETDLAHRKVICG